MEEEIINTMKHFAELAVKCSSFNLETIIIRDTDDIVVSERGTNKERLRVKSLAEMESFIKGIEYGLDAHDKLKYMGLCRNITQKY